MYRENIAKTDEKKPKINIFPVFTLFNREFKAKNISILLPTLHTPPFKKPLLGAFLMEK